jgi:flavin-dependent dehydrogenase
VGASFAGLTLAHHLPKNYRILILDKKRSLDSAIETTGLITNPTKDEFSNFICIEDYIDNAIYNLNVVNSEFREIFSSGTADPWIYTLNTKSLIKKLTESLPENVTLKLNAIYGSPNSYFHKGMQYKFKAKFLIGADGANSSVAKSNSKLSQNKKYLIGLEKVFHGEIDKKTIYHFWFGEFSLGYGGWLAPITFNGQKAFRVGLAKYRNSEGFKTLNRFIDRLVKEKFINPKGEAIEQFGSHIPIGGPAKKPFHKNTLLIGDAAGLCGAFAADGIKGALISAKVAANLIQKGSFKDYYKEIEKHNYLMSYFKRQKLYRFAWDQMKTNESFDILFDIVKKEKDTFIQSFCDNKDKHKSLAGSVFKFKNIPLLIKYALTLFKKPKSFRFGYLESYRKTFRI